MVSFFDGYLAICPAAQLAIYPSVQLATEEELTLAARNTKSNLSQLDSVLVP